MANQTKRVTIIRGTDKEWLKEAIDNGMLTGEALTRCEIVMKENEHLSRDNDFLRGIISGKNQTIKSFQKVQTIAMKYKAECEARNRKAECLLWVVMGTLLVVGITAFVVVVLA